MKKLIIIYGVTIILILILEIILSIPVKNKMIMAFNEENMLLIEKNNISTKYISYLYKDQFDCYRGIITDNNNELLEIEDLIKDGSIYDFNNKILELLRLKYPKYIVESLINDSNKEFLLRENELIIYFDNSNIVPKTQELLYLTVNYNEIKDYLNFTFILDTEYTNESGYNYTNSKKSVAITFDDGPSNNTNKILKSLRDNHFHATFFILGEKSVGNKDLLINIKNDNNEIGSHTYNHKNMQRMSNEEIIEDYNIMNSFYKKIFNENIKLVRPPYGSYKKEALNLLDVSYIMWSLDTNDWRYHNKDYLINYVLNNIKDGDIILFHDTYNSTALAVDELLKELYSRGYQVMSVSELFQLKNKKLNNDIYYNAK